MCIRDRYYLSGLFDRVLYLKDGEIEGDYTAEEFCGLSARQRDDMGLRPLDLAGLSEVEGTPQRMNEEMCIRDRKHDMEL